MTLQEIKKIRDIAKAKTLETGVFIDNVFKYRNGEKGVSFLWNDEEEMLYIISSQEIARTMEEPEIRCVPYEFIQHMVIHTKNKVELQEILKENLLKPNTSSIVDEVLKRFDYK